MKNMKNILLAIVFATTALSLSACCTTKAKKSCSTCCTTAKPTSCSK